LTTEDTEFLKSISGILPLIERAKRQDAASTL